MTEVLIAIVAFIAGGLVGLTISAALVVSKREDE